MRDDGIVHFSQLLVFVMSYAVDGKITTENERAIQLINGTSRAHRLCQKDAERAGLWGIYSALLSTKQHSLQNITEERYHHLPVVNTVVSALKKHASLCVTLQMTYTYLLGKGWEISAISLVRL